MMHSESEFVNILIATKVQIKTKAQDVNYFILCNDLYICSIIAKLKR